MDFYEKMKNGQIKGMISRRMLILSYADSVLHNTTSPIMLVQTLKILNCSSS